MRSPTVGASTASAQSGDEYPSIILVTAVAMFLGGALLSILSLRTVTGDGRQECGPILSTSANWYPQTFCGIVHRGTLGVVGALLLTAIGLHLAGRLSRTRSASLRVATALVLATLVFGCGATVWLIRRTATESFVEMAKSWTVVRDTAALSTTAVLAVAAFLVRATLTGLERT